MKIVIPCNEDQKTVCESFGRAPFFCIFEDGKTEFAANPAADAEGGAGPKAAQAVLDSGADILLTVRCGQNAAEVLKMGEIKIYQTKHKELQQNIQDFLNNNLEELTHFHAGFHGVQ